MIHSKLIIIEGYPGSGKTTLGYRLEASLTKAGLGCTLYQETHPEHPVHVGDSHDLKTTLNNFEAGLQKFLTDWKRFAEDIAQKSGVIIVESRYWLTGLSLLQLQNRPEADIIALAGELNRSISQANPCLIYLSSSSNNMERVTQDVFNWKNSHVTKTVDGKNWEAIIIDSLQEQPWFTSRGLQGRAGYTQWVLAWMRLADQLFSEFPFDKVKLEAEVSFSDLQSQAETFLLTPTLRALDV